MFIWLDWNRTFEKKQKGMESDPTRKNKNKKRKRKKTHQGAGGFFEFIGLYTFLGGF